MNNGICPVCGKEGMLGDSCEHYGSSIPLESNDRTIIDTPDMRIVDIAPEKPVAEMTDPHEQAIVAHTDANGIIHVSFCIDTKPVFSFNSMDETSTQRIHDWMLEQPGAQAKMWVRLMIEAQQQHKETT